MRFGPLPDDAVTTILKQQDIQDAGLLQRLVRLADGSPGQALALYLVPITLVSALEECLSVPQPNYGVPSSTNGQNGESAGEAPVVEDSRAKLFGR